MWRGLHHLHQRLAIPGCHWRRDCMYNLQFTITNNSFHFSRFFHFLILLLLLLFLFHCFYILVISFTLSLCLHLDTPKALLLMFFSLLLLLNQSSTVWKSIALSLFFNVFILCTFLFLFTICHLLLFAFTLICLALPFFMCCSSPLSTCSPLSFSPALYLYMCVFILHQHHHEDKLKLIVSRKWIAQREGKLVRTFLSIVGPGVCFVLCPRVTLRLWAFSKCPPSVFSFVCTFPLHLHSVTGPKRHRHKEHFTLGKRKKALSLCCNNDYYYYNIITATGATGV